MAQKKEYSRYFIILQEDEKGYSLSNDKIPSGYVKLELKSDKCKVSYYVQNLKRGNSPYYMLLVCNKKDAKKLIKVSEMNIDEFGRTETSFEYPADNIADTLVPMDRISGAAIVKIIEGNIVSVMSGFSTTDIPEWKTFEMMDRVKNETLRDIKVENNLFDDYEEKIAIKVETQEPQDPFKYLVRDLDTVENFQQDIKRCKWYKVPSEKFNDFSEISYPIVNLYQYVKEKGHFLLGYKYDKEDNLKYLIYGVSGRSERSGQPLNGESGFVTWVDGKEEGYWLMFYDYKTSTIVVPAK